MSLLMKNPSLRSEAIFTPLLLQMNQRTLPWAVEVMLETRQGKELFLPCRDDSVIRHAMHRTEAVVSDGASDDLNTLGELFLIDYDLIIRDGPWCLHPVFFHNLHHVKEHMAWSFS